MPTAERLVVHVVPRDLARGAQVFARTLVDRLATSHPGVRHCVLTLFAAPAGVLRADHRLEVPQGRWRDVGFDPRAAARLRGALRRLRPDAVVTHGGEALLYAAAAVPRGTPLVHKRIGITSEEHLTPARRLLHRAAMRRAALVVAVSTETLQETSRLFAVPEHRLRLVANGRDPDVYRPGPPRPDDVPPRVVFVGHLEPVKRPERFIAVVAALREVGVAVEAAMAGDGPLLDELAGPAAAAGVELLGRCDDVPALLAGSDLLCLTSRSEGMPGVLIEAGLAGLPVVTTDVSGARAVVADGDTGAVVPVDDLDASVDAVRALLDDPDLRRRQGAAARIRCVERFSIDTSARRWRELLDEAMASPTAGDDPGEVDGIAG